MTKKYNPMGTTQIPERKSNLRTIVLITIAFFSISLPSCTKDPVTPDNPSNRETPSAPTNVFAYPDDTKDSITWSSVYSATNYVTKYYVYAAPVSGYKGTIVATITATSATTYSFIHTGLTNGVPYYYYVTALNSAGEGAKSSEVSATPNVPLSKTTSVVILQDLPAICNAAPLRYYDPTNKDWGLNPRAITDTFHLYAASYVIKGIDTTLYGNSDYRFSANPKSTPPNVLLKYSTPKAVLSIPLSEFNKAQAIYWLNSGDAQVPANKVIPGTWDTLPVPIKISGLTDLSKIKSIWVRVPTDYHMAYPASVPVMYEKTFVVSDFLAVNGWAKLDKAKETLYKVNGDFYFIVPVKNQRDVNPSFEIRITYTDGSVVEQMLLYYGQ